MFIRIFLVLLVGLGLLGLVGAFLLSQQQPPPPAPVVNVPPPPIRVLVASRTVRAGALIVPEDLEAAATSEDKIVPGSLRDTQANRMKLRGAMLRRSLAQGEAFMPGDFLSPGDRGFLAAVLEPGMRAVSVGVDAVTGTAGLIWPGDRVDLLLTQSLEDQTLPTDHRVAGETVMEDVRVIAVDQQLVQGAQGGANGQPQAPGNRTITLEVSPVDAERVEVAARLGKLSLSVHPAQQVVVAPGEPAVTPEPPAPVFAGDVSAALRTRGGKVNGAVKVYRGASDAVEYKF
jgi:pilus assembly protein CpaB